jgi:predicted Zn-dependent peptidase
MTAAAPRLARFELPHGVPVLVATRPGAPATTVSLWVMTGSRYEPPAVLGVTHLLEHVLMQATLSGSSDRVIDRVEALGGDGNAVTTRDHLVLYARVPTAEAAEATQVLCTSLVDVQLDPGTIESERKVVVEELRLAASDPADVVHDVFFRAAFPDHPIGRPVGGTVDAVARLTAEDLAACHAERVHAGTVAVVVCGGLDAAEVRGQLERGALGRLEPGAWTAGADPGAAPPRLRAARAGIEVNSDSASVVIGGAGRAYGDPELATYEVLMELIGGGNASLLHEEIRTRRGLSYDLWAYAGAYQGAGIWRVAVATAPERVEEVIETATSLLAGQARKGWTAEQVAMAARRAAGLQELELESSLEEALLVGRHVLVGGDRDWTVAGHLEATRRVGADGVNAACEAIGDELVVATAGGDAGADAPTEEAG